MSSAIWYNKNRILKCSSSFLGVLSDKMIDLAMEKGRNIDENLIGFIICLMPAVVSSLNKLSTEEVKIFAELAIEAIDFFLEAKYFDGTEEDREFAIKHGFDPAGKFRDYYPTLKFKEHMQEILKELEVA